MRSIVVAGFMGVGKTTVGRALAARLGLPFLDTDAALAERYGPIAAQFAADGEAAFRSRERALIAALCDGVPRVVAVGGGAWADPDNRRRLRAGHVAVVLRASLPEIRRRLAGDTTRPLWGEGAAALYESRRAAYEDADVIVDVDGRTVDAVVEEVLWRVTPSKP